MRPLAKTAEGFLQGETDDEASGPEGRHHGANLDAEGGKGHQQTDDEDQPSGHLAHEIGQESGDLLLALERPAGGPPGVAGQEPSPRQDDQRNQDALQRARSADHVASLPGATGGRIDRPEVALVLEVEAGQRRVRVGEFLGDFLGRRCLSALGISGDRGSGNG